MDETLLVITTMPEKAQAEQLARTLVERGLAACVNIGAAVTSIYRWEGALQQGKEYPMTVKTTRAAYPALEAAIVAQHPYELPEVIALPITAGLNDYLAWIETCTNDC